MSKTTGSVQWWDATYVTGPDAERKMTGSFAAIKSWVRAIEKGIPRSVFKQPMTIERDDLKQWGTGYWWLLLEPHHFREGEKPPVEAYSDTTGATYPTWEDLIAAEANGYLVTCLITDKGTWPTSWGPFPTKAEAERVRNNKRNKFKRDQKKGRYSGQTYQFFVKPAWKVL